MYAAVTHRFDAASAAAAESSTGCSRCWPIGRVRWNGHLLQYGRAVTSAADCCRPTPDAQSVQSVSRHYLQTVRRPVAEMLDETKYGEYSGSCTTDGHAGAQRDRLTELDV